MGETVNRKILVAEDEPAISSALSDYARHMGYSVTTAFNGVEAVDLAVQEKPDVILLDILMPQLDGRDVMARLKKEGIIEKTVVLFVTGRDEQWDRVVGLELGADDYETKPIHFQTLFAKIERLLKKKRGE